MRAFLRSNKLDILASQEEKYDFIIQIAEGKLDFDAIVYWLRNNTVSI